MKRYICLLLVLFTLCVTSKVSSDVSIDISLEDDDLFPEFFNWSAMDEETFLRKFIEAYVENDQESMIALVRLIKYLIDDFFLYSAMKNSLRSAIECCRY